MIEVATFIYLKNKKEIKCGLTTAFCFTNAVFFGKLTTAHKNKVRYPFFGSTEDHRP